MSAFSSYNQGACYFAGECFGPLSPTSNPFTPGGPFIQLPRAPGTRCPTCAQEGKEVWVIPGRCCGYCGTPCDGDIPHHEHEEAYQHDHE